MDGIPTLCFALRGQGAVLSPTWDRSHRTGDLWKLDYLSCTLEGSDAWG